MSGTPVNSQSNSDSFKKLQEKLKEMFLLDRGDLDFGIYRIMQSNRDKIEKFLNDDLLPQVKTALTVKQSADRSLLQKQMDEAISQASSLGVDPDAVPKIHDMRQKLTESVDLHKIENEIYSDLYNFFKRYYSEGDFLSLRRYKEGVYALPYEGEEVKLHWVNADQYYIKSTENLSSYVFRTPSNRRVRFEVVEGHTEQNNNKAEAGRERRFMLVQENPVTIDQGDMILRFEYKPDPYHREQWRPKRQAEKQTLNEITVETVKKCLSDQEELRELFSVVGTDNKPDRTLLEKHLDCFTARNTFDYFIHKDLGGFLRRELDFYIKNEIMYLDDIENESIPRVEQYLSKIKVLRLIAGKIIRFLEQLEKFQKKLWLKKKFVLETQYCMTLDRIPESFYAEIVANEEQSKEWVRLFAIDEIREDLTKPGYSKPLTIDFLKENHFLVLDTVFFDRDFKERLLGTLDHVDDKINGHLIHSENFQGLNFIQNRFTNRIDVTYIDPPYNAKTSEILYKNTYKHSSWLSLMQDRIIATQSLQTNNGTLIIAIDENEHEKMALMLDQLYPDFTRFSVSVVHNKKGIQGNYFSFNSEYAVFVLPPSLSALNEQQIPESEWKYSNLRNWGNESERESAKNCFYPIYIENNQIIGFGDVCPEDFHPGKAVVEHNHKTLALYPVDEDGVERKWRYSRESIAKIKDILRVSYIKNGIVKIEKPQTTDKFKTVWDKNKYIAGDYGTKMLTHMGFSKGLFDFPKSLYLVEDCLYAVSKDNAHILDYFGGSGTTAHAVIDLNRKDSGSRKYILLEMGAHFDSVLLNRVKKAIYSKDWKAGKPVDRQGLSHMFKYMRLESYEDTLDNLELHPTAAQDSLLKGNRLLCEDYILSYWLDVESKGSNSLLNLQAFTDPFNYKLRITRHGVIETAKVDLVETFNWLLGLTVLTMKRMEDVYVVTGTDRRGDKIVILWRHLETMSNKQLDQWFDKQMSLREDCDLKLIYVNGDCTLEALKQSHETWTVRLIETDFHRLMFDVQDV